MSENSTNNNVNNDEIDLLDLFRRIGNTIRKWFNSLGRAFLISVVFLLKKWLPLGISIVLGVLFAYMLKFTSDSSYKSDLVLRNNAIQNSEMIGHINKLHRYFDERNFEALNSLTSINGDLLKNVNDICAYWIIDKGNDEVPDYVDYSSNHNVYDTLNVRMKDFIDIQISIKTPQELAIVRNGIVKFITSDTLFQKINNTRIRQKKEMLQRISLDITQLDSLQKIINRNENKRTNLQTNNQMVFLQEQKTQLLYPEIQNLYTRKQIIEVELDLYPDIITVINDFSVPSRRINGVFYYAKKVAPIFFLITLIILILYSNKKKLNEIYNKY